MRLWSIHPKYLDTKGLVALWREGLLAQKVLRGETRGYRNHPQLRRFKESKDPTTAIGTYLHYAHEESLRRDYRFDLGKIGDIDTDIRLDVTSGQVTYEMQHLIRKLEVRDPLRYSKVKLIAEPYVHPMFRAVSGDIADWEITE